MHKPVPDATAGLNDLLVPAVTDIEVRHQVARAIGMGGLTRDMVPQIFEKLNDAALKSDAELALILGADADTASRALATYNDPNVPAEAIEELKDIYNKTFGYWSDQELRERRHRAVGRERAGARARQDPRPASGLAADHPRAQPGRVDRDSTTGRTR